MVQAPAPHVHRQHVQRQHGAIVWSHKMRPHSSPLPHIPPIRMRTWSASSRAHFEVFLWECAFQQTFSFGCRQTRCAEHFDAVEAFAPPLFIFVDDL